MTRARVCVAQSVICSDAFLELPATARALYPCLLLEADNDGALDSPRRIARTYGAAQADMDALIDAGYLLDVGGVLFVTDWWVHNTKDKHNYREGAHQDALSMLEKDMNRRYVLSAYHQSDESLASAANTKQNNSSEMKSSHFISDEKGDGIAAAAEAAPPSRDDASRPVCPLCSEPVRFNPSAGKWTCPICGEIKEPVFSAWKESA